MARIPIPANHMVRLHAVPNAGMPQVFSTFITVLGQRECIDDKLPPSVGYRHYIELPVDWVLDVVGGHFDHGVYKGSNEARYDPNANPVMIGYDDSGGPGVDFTNLRVFVEKVRMNSLGLASGHISAKTSQLFNLMALRATLESPRVSMTKYRLKLTDGSGDDGYAVLLKKEASVWDDDSSSGHEISEITQGGNVYELKTGLACSDGAGGNSLLLVGASWSMQAGDSGSAHRQKDPANSVEEDWIWLVESVRKV
ncbi:hypothetical protein [Mycoplana sp. MJR14]|uniref:hypothetical protein n=1 Tax=Mycoplana sp. MJR14 TaxID=3032583 RepID=UPI0023DCAE99|nr:hypothetical protein [Mycoplana sp. MJR14]MDF1635578.1 hypothetical protein [Mycoplana sp. MJR14]